MLKFIKIIVTIALVLDILVYPLYSSTRNKSNYIRAQSLFAVKVSKLLEASEFKDGIEQGFVREMAQQLERVVEDRNFKRFKQHIDGFIENLKIKLKSLVNYRALFGAIREDNLEWIKQYFKTYEELYRQFIDKSFYMFDRFQYEENFHAFLAKNKLNKIGDNEGRNLLQKAWSCNSLTIYLYLYEDIFKSNNQEELIDFIKACVKEGIINEQNVEYDSTKNKSYLHYAVESGDLELVEDLLSLGAEVDAVYLKDTTPLHYACAHSDLDMVKLLLSYDGNPDYLYLASTNVKDFDGYPFDGLTPIHLAVLNKNKKNRHEILDYLMEQYVLDVNYSNDYSFTPMHFAAIEQDMYLVSKFKKYKGDINKTVKIEISNYFVDNATSYNESSILHYAAQKGDVEAVRFLVEDLGMDINSLNEYKISAMHVSLIENMNFEVLEYFVKKGFDIKEPFEHDNVLNSDMERDPKEFFKYIVRFINYYLEHGKTSLSEILRTHEDFINMPQYDVYVLNDEQQQSLNSFIKFVLKIISKFKESEEDKENDAMKDEDEENEMDDKEEQYKTLYDKCILGPLKKQDLDEWFRDLIESENGNSKDIDIIINNYPRNNLYLKAMFLRILTDLFLEVEKEGSSINFYKLLEEEKKLVTNEPSLREDIDYLITKLKRIKVKQLCKLFSLEDSSSNIELLIFRYGDKVIDSYMRDYTKSYSYAQKLYIKSLEEDIKWLEEEKERLESENRKENLSQESKDELKEAEEIFKNSKKQYETKKQNITEGDIFMHYMLFGFADRYIYSDDISVKKLLETEAVIYYLIDIIVEYLSTGMSMQESDFITKITKELQCEPKEYDLLFNLSLRMIEESQFEIVNYIIDIMLNVNNGEYLSDFLDSIKQMMDKKDSDDNKLEEYQEGLIEILEVVCKDRLRKKFIEEIIDWSIKNFQNKGTKKIIFLKHLLDSKNKIIRAYTGELVENKLEELRGDQNNYMEDEASEDKISHSYLDLLNELILINKVIYGDAEIKFGTDIDYLVKQIGGKIEVEPLDDDMLDDSMYLLWLLGFLSDYEDFLDYEEENMADEDEETPKEKMVDEDEEKKEKGRLCALIFEKINKRVSVYRERYYNENIYDINEEVNEDGDTRLHIYVRRDDKQAVVQAIKNGANMIAVNDFGELPGGIICEKTKRGVEVNLDITCFPETNNWMKISSDEDVDSDEDFGDGMEDEEVEFYDDEEDNEQDENITGKKRGRERGHKGLKIKKRKVGENKVSEDLELIQRTGIKRTREDIEKMDQECHMKDEVEEDRKTKKIKLLTSGLDEEKKLSLLKDLDQKQREIEEIEDNIEINNDEENMFNSRVGEKRRKDSLEDLIEGKPFKKRKFSKESIKAQDTEERVSLFADPEKDCYEFKENGIILNVLMDNHEKKVLELLDIFFGRAFVRKRLYYRIYTNRYNLDENDCDFEELIKDYGLVKDIVNAFHRLMSVVQITDLTVEEYLKELKECLQRLQKCLIFKGKQLEQDEFLEKIVKFFPEIKEILQEQCKRVIIKKQRLSDRIVLTLSNYGKVEIYSTKEIKVIEPILDISSIINYSNNEQEYQEVLSIIVNTPRELIAKIIMLTLTRSNQKFKLNKSSIESLRAAS